MAKPPDASVIGSSSGVLALLPMTAVKRRTSLALVSSRKSRISGIADIGDAVGDEDYRAGTVGIERVEAHFEAGEEVGAAFRRDVAAPIRWLARPSPA